MYNTDMRMIYTKTPKRSWNAEKKYVCFKAKQSEAKQNSLQWKTIKIPI